MAPKTAAASSSTRAEVAPLILKQDYDPEDVDPQNEKEHELVEELLPWGFEQRVSVILNFVKIPLILVVCVLGSVVEIKMASATTKLWTSHRFRSGPACYVNLIDVDKWFWVNNTIADRISGYVNATTWWLKQGINASFENSTASKYCTKDADGDVRCQIIDTTKWVGAGNIGNLTFDKDLCGIEEVDETDDRGAISEVCTVNEDEVTPKEDLANGLNWRIPGLPFLPHCLVWAVYKLLFLPVHPIDRIVNTIDGSEPPPQPIFKLITEPHFQKCTKVMRVFVFILKMIRYTMLPNSLIVPLLTMGSHKKCTSMFYYKFDNLAGNAVFVWIVFEMVLVMALYAYGKGVMGSKCVGTCKYRLYKFYWFTSSCVAVVLFITDQVMIFNWRFWQGLSFILRAAVTLDLDYKFSVDLVQLLASMNVFLDVISLIVMLASFLCPKLIQRMTDTSDNPFLKGLNKKNDDNAAGAAASPPTASTATASPPTASTAGGGSQKKGGMMSSFTSKIPGMGGR